MTGVAIVTGAGSGIGRATALRLAADGYAVVVNDVAAASAAATAAAIEAAGGRAIGIAGDVSDEAAVASLEMQARATFGACTLLVNNAGIAQQARFLDLTPADFDRMFAVHVRGTFLCIRAVLPAMLAEGSGVIVNIASQLGQIGGIELAHYSAAKSAIIGLTKSLAREVGRLGITVNAVAPGFIATEMTAGLQDDDRARIAARAALRRLAEPADVANAVSYLLADNARNITGTVLTVDAGATA